MIWCSTLHSQRAIGPRRFCRAGTLWRGRQRLAYHRSNAHGKLLCLCEIEAMDGMTLTDSMLMLQQAVTQECLLISQLTYFAVQITVLLGTLTVSLLHVLRIGLPLRTTFCSGEAILLALHASTLALPLHTIVTITLNIMSANSSVRLRLGMMLIRSITRPLRSVLLRDVLLFVMYVGTKDVHEIFVFNSCCDLTVW